MLLVYASRPVIDWILANSVQGAAAIGLLSFTLFGLVAIRNWRDGTKIASTLRHRMTQNPSADTGNTRGLHVIAGGLVFVWLAVLAFGLAEVNEE